MSVKYSGADWVQENWEVILKNAQRTAKRRGDFIPKDDARMSPFGVQVADILGQAFEGIYHIRDAVFSTDWTNDHWVRVTLSPGSLSTFDGSLLTILVVLCHDAPVRMDIEPHSNRSLGLMFHPRERDGGIGRRHPTLEDQMTRIRGHYSLPILAVSP